MAAHSMLIIALAAATMGAASSNPMSGVIVITSFAASQRSAREENLKVLRRGKNVTPYGA